MEQINTRYIQCLSTVFFFYKPQTATISHSSLGLQLIWFPTNIVFSIYDGLMLLSCSSDIDICLYGWAHGESSRGCWRLRKMLAWLPFPLNAFCFLTASCPEGHKCTTGTCSHPTYGAGLSHSHTGVCAHTCMFIRINEHTQATGQNQPRLVAHSHMSRSKTCESACGHVRMISKFTNNICVFKMLERPWKRANILYQRVQSC